jgi:DNA-binding NarL/FixJ family response regulator
MVDLNVFLVEDSPLVLQRLAKLLETVPDTKVVGHAANAQAAIRGILDTKPDVVVLDLHLAPGSGFDVLSAVHPSLPDTDIFVLSNFSSQPYRRQAHRLGARDFFDKSHDFERVRDAIAARANTTKH